MKILIVGAGIGGLAAANFLEPHGHDITIIERAHEFKHIGFGMSLFSIGRRMLRELGLDDIVAKNGHEVPWIELADAAGHLLGHKINFHVFRKYGEPIITIERAALHGTLATHLKTAVRFGTTVEIFTQSKNHVRVTFNDGSRGKFDLVIGADGIHSGVREALFGPGESSFYGWSVRLFWVPGHIPAPRGSICLSRESTTLAFYPLKGKCLAALYEYNPLLIDHPPLKLGGFLPYLSRHGWQQKHIEALEHEAREGRQYYDHLRRIRLGQWHKGRVVLLGDARHGLSPLTGMGASMALEDAFVLSDELAKVNAADIPLALHNYSVRRTLRIEEMTSLNNLVEWFFLIRSPLARMMRNAVTRFFPTTLIMDKFGRLLGRPL